MVPRQEFDLWSAANLYGCILKSMIDINYDLGVSSKSKSGKTWGLAQKSTMLPLHDKNQKWNEV